MLNFSYGVSSISHPDEMKWKIIIIIIIIIVRCIAIGPLTSGPGPGPRKFGYHQAQDQC